ncbi:uncharacterized protein [Euwallacea fornicatus]|uniref:uncharacterized protein n=1 Tax=Euwallacea fornicatus TaxID=995702 RepID=UPI00338F2EFB
MKNKHTLIGSVILCIIICRVYSTSILFDKLIKGLENGRCKLHNIGLKLIRHEHYHGDPCKTSETTHENQLSTPKGNFDFQHVEATSEAYPSSLNIDIRSGQEETTDEPKISSVFKESKDKYEPVPKGGGKNLIKAGCNGQVQTNDGCMEEI